MYTIINTITYDKVLVYTPIGYTTNTSLIAEINENYDTTLGSWILNNMEGLINNSINLSQYFDDNVTSLYIARTTSTNVDGLTEITEI